MLIFREPSTQLTGTYYFTNWINQVIEEGWSILFLISKKTSFRLKINGKISEPISENIGVNQGSITSPFLFKEYLSDIKHYLDNSTGVCIDDEILVHVLWADDLYMVADRPSNSQKQLNVLSEFCSPNHMIINEAKTKFRVYGDSKGVKLYLNGN